MTTKKVQKRGASRKAPRLSATDWTAAEQIRNILFDPKAPRRVKGQLEELTYKLYAETNAFMTRSTGLVRPTKYSGG